MKNWLCFNFLILLILPFQLFSQEVGIFHSSTLFQYGFFPERSIDNPSLKHLYWTGERGENSYVVDDHYDFRRQSSFQFGFFLDDVIQFSFLNYLELAYGYEFYDLVLAGNIVDNDGKYAGPRVGYQRFYKHNLHKINLGLGRSIIWYNEKQLYFKSIFSINISMLADSDIYFSISEPLTMEGFGNQSFLAQDRLYTLNFGLNTQHRIGYNISERFSVFAGFNLGVWLNPVSRSNQDYLDYLDTFEDEYGKLYKMRKGPFPYLGWQAGLVYHFKKSRR